MISAVQVSNLIVSTLQAIRHAGQYGPVLDLACGSGRNGVYLVGQGQPVVFADRDQAKLDEIARTLQDNVPATFWCVDLEEPQSRPLEGKYYGTVLVCRYLHRPLMAAIRDSVQAGGIVIYETFTRDQPQFGRPTNPDFLLQAGELEKTFRGWEILHSFEGVTVSETSGREQAIAQIVARRPDDDKLRP